MKQGFNKIIASIHFCPSPANVLLIICMVGHIINLVVMCVVPETALFRIFLQSSTTGYDFFNSVRDAMLPSPYAEAGVIYPPLANLLYRIFGSLFLEAYRWGPLSGSVGFLLFEVISICLLFSACSEYIANMHCNKAFVWPFVFSIGALYSLERGNIVLLTAALTVMFFLHKDAASPWKREIGFICLAVGAGLKLYPALFGLILIFEKRWRESLRLILYGILAFILPLLAFEEGLAGAFQLVKNIKNFSGQPALVYNISLYSVKTALCTIIGIAPTPVSLRTKIIFILAAAMILCAITTMWKRILTISLLVLMLLDTQFVYCLVFLLPACCCFIREAESSWLNYISAVLLGLTLIPLQLPQLPALAALDISYYPQHDVLLPYQTGTLVEGICLLLLFGLLFVDAIHCVCIQFQSRKAEYRVNS